MIVTATLTDQLGRRPLTVYPYAVTVVSVLCLGIIGCFDYTAKATSSLLVSQNSKCENTGAYIFVDIFRLFGNLFYNRRFSYRLCVRGRDSPAATSCANCRMVTRAV